jgi:hypothetical protein
MVEHMVKMCAWHTQSFKGLPSGDGYETEVTKVDYYKDESGVCHDQDGVKVSYWRRSHTEDGASAYRLDWNDLSFVWTGDGKPDECRLPASSNRINPRLGGFMRSAHSVTRTTTLLVALALVSAGAGAQGN